MRKLVIAALLSAGLCLSASANLLVNGAFTEGDGGWDFSSAAISIVNWGGGDVHSDGGAAVTTYWDGGDTWGGNATQVVSLEDTRYYDISVWYQEDPGFNAQSVYYNVEWADASGSWGDKMETSITRPNEKTWTETTASLTAPAYATQARIEIGYYTSETFSNTGFFDDASFVAVPEPVSAGLLGLGLAFIYLLRKKVSR